jgi:cell wall-associated NlpC family hydrolase
VSVAQSTIRRASASRAAGSTREDWQRQSVVRVALRHKGSRYVYGSAGPTRFDCSGFTMYVYRQATGKKLPHYSGAQMKRAQRVSVKHMRPGDLMFYGRGGSQHVSMYIGRGKMIHAANPRAGVRVDSIHSGYWKARFAGAGRLIQH